MFVFFSFPLPSPQICPVSTTCSECCWKWGEWRTSVRMQLSWSQISSLGRLEGKSNIASHFKSLVSGNRRNYIESVTFNALSINCQKCAFLFKAWSLLLVTVFLRVKFLSLCFAVVIYLQHEKVRWLLDVFFLRTCIEQVSPREVQKLWKQALRKAAVFKHSPAFWLWLWGNSFM